MRNLVLGGFFVFRFSFCRCCYCFFFFFALLVASCPSGWFNEGSSCYKLSLYHQNWQAAKTTCESMGSTLAIVNSQAEQQALKPHIKRTSTWIGLHRHLSDKTNWLWVDGSRLTYTHWATYEPNNIDEECVEMRPSARWNDLGCSRRLRFICEKGNKSDNTLYIVQRNILLRWSLWKEELAPNKKNTVVAKRFSFVDRAFFTHLIRNSFAFPFRCQRVCI